MGGTNSLSKPPGDEHRLPGSFNKAILPHAAIELLFNYTARGFGEIGEISKAHSKRQNKTWQLNLK